MGADPVSSTASVAYPDSIAERVEALDLRGPLRNLEEAGYTVLEGCRPARAHAGSAGRNHPLCGRDREGRV